MTRHVGWGAVGAYSRQVQQRRRPGTTSASCRQAATCPNDRERPRRQEFASRGGQGLAGGDLRAGLQQTAGEGAIELGWVAEGAMHGHQRAPFLCRSWRYHGCMCRSWLTAASTTST